MDSSLLEISKNYPNIVFKQSKKLFYKKFNTLIRIQLLNRRNSSSTLFQRLIIKRFYGLIRTRSEGYDLGIFLDSNTVDIAELIEYLKTLTATSANTGKTKKLDELIYEIHYDSVGLESKQIVLPTIKNKGFKYKLLIRTGFNQFDTETKKSLTDVIDQNPDLFKVTKSTNHWLRSNLKSNWELKYIYVKDETMLTFLKLSCNNIVGRVYEII